LNSDTYLKAFHSSPAAICISTLREGRFVEVNESFCKLAGYSREELMGITSSELKMWAHPDERPRIAAILSERRSIPE
jgi:PAS domain S-box-containing protein